MKLFVKLFIYCSIIALINICNNIGWVEAKPRGHANGALTQLVSTDESDVPRDPPPPPPQFRNRRSIQTVAAAESVVNQQPPQEPPQESPQGFRARRAVAGQNANEDDVARDPPHQLRPKRQMPEPKMPPPPQPPM